MADHDDVTAAKPQRLTVASSTRPRHRGDTATADLWAGMRAASGAV